MIMPNAQIATLFPAALPGHRERFEALHSVLFGEFGLVASLLRLYFFLAQIGHESRGLSVERERLGYSTQRLMQIWPRRFPDESAAAGFTQNPQALANHVYANRNGNGPAESGDGYRYRGRGYLQLTGRDGYRAVGKVCGLPLEDQPGLACHPDHALRVALGFWAWKDMNGACDTGDFKAVTRRINGGLNGWADRVKWLDRVKRVLR